MNTNRGNNRRRGRNNNRSQGGQQLNRIDSRARGNAPQLLDKYKKLAEDAHRNGDRVQAEYYLQFADHYFRVIADGKVRHEEQRQRRDDRQQDDDEAGESYRRSRRGEIFDGDEQEDEDSGSGSDQGRGRAARDEGDEENPFVRDSRARQPRRSRRPDEDENGRGHDTAGDDRDGAVFDPNVLPPAISAGREQAEAVDGEEAPAAEPRAKAAAKKAKAAPSADKPRRTRRPRKPATADDAADVQEAVNG